MAASRSDSCGPSPRKRLATEFTAVPSTKCLTTSSRVVAEISDMTMGVIRAKDLHVWASSTAESGEAGEATITEARSLVSAHVPKWRESLASTEESRKAAALEEMRRLVKTQGHNVQNAILETKDLFKAIVDECMVAGHFISNIAMRALSCLVVRNRAVTATVLANKPLLDCIFKHILCINTFTSSPSAECLPQRLLVAACLWTLAALCRNSPAFCASLVGTMTRSDILDAVAKHLVVFDCPDCQTASAGVLYCFFTTKPGFVSGVLLVVPVFSLLLQLLCSNDTSWQAKACGLWALRAMLVNNDVVTVNFVLKHGHRLVLSIMSSTTNHVIAASGLMLLATAVKCRHHQAVSLCVDEDIIRAALRHLCTDDVFVNLQAVLVLQNACTDNADACRLTALDCAVEQLLDLLLRTIKHYPSATLIDTTLATLLLLVRENNDNKRKFFAVPFAVRVVLQLQRATSLRIVTLSINLMRALTTNDSVAQGVFGAHGALAVLSAVCNDINDKRIESLVLVAMLCLMANCAANVALARFLHLEELAFRVLKDCCKSTKLSYRCCVDMLYVLCFDATTILDKCKTDSVLIHALLRLSHQGIADENLRVSADRLLQLVSPLTRQARISQLPHAALDALRSCVLPGFTCPICLDDECEKQEAVFLPCIHTVHRHCMSTWISHGNDTCPTCKFSLLSTMHSLLLSNSL